MLIIQLYDSKSMDNYCLRSTDPGRFDLNTVSKGNSIALKLRAKTVREETAGEHAFIDLKKDLDQVIYTL